jgi:hypothetical protein
MFRSFFLAGFECATGYNRHGEWIDQIAATRHDQNVREDYRLLSEVGIHAVREAIRWPLVDGRGHYDFSTVEPFVDAAREHGMEVIWDLFHYGYPDDLDIFSTEFVERFADYCHAVACYIRKQTDGPHYFTPINEPSYFSWAGGESGLFAPHASGRGPDLKVQLARAGITGIDAIRVGCPGARIVNADPICHVVPPSDAPELASEAAYFNNVAVFESWDMLCGRLLPELGGSRQHLDIVGLNYYWTNQWELGSVGTPLADGDPRRRPLRDLICAAWQRYEGDVIVTETAHVGERRAHWLRELACEAEALLQGNVPLRGICLYPILGMPEWHAPDEWTPMGLWDPDRDCEEFTRVPHEPALEALCEAQRIEKLIEESFLSP